MTPVKGAAWRRAVPVAVWLLAAFATNALGQPRPEDAALGPAQAWLGLVGQGQYARSWDEASTLFKGTLTRERWGELLTGVRPPLGKVVSRKVKSRQFLESLPGAPDGKYVVIQFDTVFEKKAAAVETVTPMLDRDGSWRVSGYYIK